MIDETEQEKSKKEGKRFLIKIISFFLIFIAVDAFFVYKALSTYNGVVVENAYEQGLNYNDIIEKAKKQETVTK